MLISRKEIETLLRNSLNEKDQASIGLITDLSWLGTIALEFGFRCPEDERNRQKEKFLELIQRFSNMTGRADFSVEFGEVFGEPTFPSEPPLTLKDFMVVCGLFRKLTRRDKTVSGDKLLEWVETAWIKGVWQRRVYSMEVEGSVLNERGIVFGFGADIALFGKDNGLIL
jgi:Fe-S-cluster formation regulator IscX/YfhJ